MNKEQVSILAVLVNFILAISKIFIGFISKSSAVMAEGIHSGMDIVSSLINYIGIKISKKPIDKKHPYGYYKFEVLSGLIITIILLITSIWIIYESITSFFTIKQISITYLTLGVMAFSIIINEVMARIKIKTGEKYDSVSLIADGKHSRVDVLTSLGVLIGLFFVKYWLHIDSLIGLLIGLYIFKESMSLGSKVTDGLLDVSAGEEIENKIKTILKKQKIKLSKLKTQKSGLAIFAELKIKLNPRLKVEEASGIIKELEKNIIKKIPSIKYVVIQIESHKIKQGFYKDIFGRKAGWKGRMEGKSLGPGGECICPKCGKILPHKRGTPCFKQKCPKCNSFMKRKINNKK